ncbi:MAG: GTP cyclohydrolase I FolE [Bdellovibrionales bacterium]|nr:GTP cyclohydrolase I FolE [Bdellovibrionales bacterium]
MQDIISDTTIGEDLSPKKESHTQDKEIRFSKDDILNHVRPTPLKENGLSDEEKVNKIAGHFREIMQTLGLDLENDSLAKSPERVAKMYVKEIFQGLSSENFPKVTVIENEMSYDQMIVIKDVNIMTFCEHHFVTIHGKAHIAYIPQKRVIGLSKVNRIAKYFSQRPQVQERLTKQIADALAFILDTGDVAVYVDAKHYCVISRGVEDVGSSTTTCDLRGGFKNDAKTRAEFMAICQREV